MSTIRVLSAVGLGGLALSGCKADIANPNDLAETLRFGQAEYRSAGCSTASEIPSTRFYNDTLTMDEGPEIREFRVGVPTNYDPTEPHALYLSMHACGGTHESVNSNLADRMGNDGIPTITLSPNSAVADASGNADAQGSDGVKCWNLNLDWYDVSFVEALIDEMMETYCIDTRNVFFSGGSSGGFGAQGIGCYAGATAITSDRGGIHHPTNVSWSSDYPQTEPPTADACGPIPAMLGFARQDTVVPLDPFEVVSRQFWHDNNGCSDETTRDFEAESVVCHDGLSNCECERYVECAAPLVICMWDGGHESASMGPVPSSWWFEQFIDGGTVDDPRNDDPPSSCEADAQTFVAEFEVDPSMWPLTPFCNECGAFGVEDDGGESVAFAIRWSSGLDPQASGDDDFQWIEQRPTETNRPFLRISTEDDRLLVESSTNGIDYRIDVDVLNPLTGPIRLFGTDEDYLSEATLTGMECPIADCSSMSGSAFEAMFETETNAFPISPYCDECESFGVRAIDGTTVDFVVRWTNGLDVRTPGDDAIQWIEQRPGQNPQPFVRLRGDGNTLIAETSADGQTWSTILTTDNPFSGTSLATFSDASFLANTTCSGQ